MTSKNEISSFLLSSPSLITDHSSLGI